MENNVLQRVEVSGLAHGGEGVARGEDGRVMFIPRVIPGEEVEVRIVQSKRSFQRAELGRVLRPSPERRPSPCPHFERCGGCDLLHMTYEAQVAHKARAAWESIARISRLGEALPAATLLPSEVEQGWRSRATFHGRRIQDRFVLGFHERGSNRLVPLTQCMILEPSLERARQALERALARTRLSAAELFVEVASTSGEVVVSVTSWTGERAVRVLEVIEALIAPGGICGVRLVGARGDVVASSGELEVSAEVVLAWCPHEVAQERLPAGMFRQAHRALNAQMVALVCEVVGEGRGGGLVELFAGCGNFSFSLVDRCVDELWAWEGAGEAVRSGARLAQRAGVSERLRFGEVDLAREGWREEVREAMGGAWPEVVVLDPPRTGAREVMEGLIEEEGVREVIYVSCEPACLGRDLEVASQGGFEVSGLWMVDMFPGAAHLEAVARLVRK